MRAVTPLLKADDTLKLVYFAYFHYVICCGGICRGNSTHCERAFIILKNTIRVMAGFKRRVSCWEIFKKFNILALVSQFLLSLLSFIVDNGQKFQTNSDIHSINKRCKLDLHQPSAKLISYQKGAYYAGIKLFSTLPDSIKSLNHDIRVFQPALKDHLFFSHCIYSVQEFTSVETY
jgi:hypothetical protein